MLKLDFNRPNKPKGITSNKGEEGSPQEAIEEAMNHAVQLGHYEVVCLFTEDGLPLAEVGENNEIGRDLLAEVAVHLQKVRETICQLDNFVGLNEIIFESHSLRKIVFRIIRAFGQNVVLAFAVPAKQSYKSFTNRLVKLIKIAGND